MITLYFSSAPVPLHLSVIAPSTTVTTGHNIAPAHQTSNAGPGARRLVPALSPRLSGPSVSFRAPSPAPSVSPIPSPGILAASRAPIQKTNFRFKKPPTGTRIQASSVPMSGTSNSRGIPTMSSAAQLINNNFLNESEFYRSVSQHNDNRVSYQIAPIDSRQLSPDPFSDSGMSDTQMVLLCDEVDPCGLATASYSLSTSDATEVTTAVTTTSSAS